MGSQSPAISWSAEMVLHLSLSRWASMGTRPSPTWSEAALPSPPGDASEGLLSPPCHGFGWPDNQQC